MFITLISINHKECESKERREGKVREKTESKRRESEGKESERGRDNLSEGELPVNF